VKRLSVLWVRGPSGHVMPHKREYTKRGGRTLCGIPVGSGWWIVAKDHVKRVRRCKRCAA
jgi:hypothetical protein